jgi:DNA-binding NarL/FixJ family response regulator
MSHMQHPPPSTPLFVHTPSDNLLVLIADDHALVRDGLKMLVTRILGSARFLEADDADSLFAAARSLPTPHLALIDLNMPGMDKGSLLPQLSRQHPLLPMVVISALTSPDIVRRVLDIDTVYAFVPKSASSEHMSAAMDSALQGLKFPFTQVEDANAGADLMLSPRLQEIRGLLRQGMSNKLIANQLGITEGTVKNHMSEIFKALNVSNRTQAAQFNADTA